MVSLTSWALVKTWHVGHGDRDSKRTHSISYGRRICIAGERKADAEEADSGPAETSRQSTTVRGWMLGSSVHIVKVSRNCAPINFSGPARSCEIRDAYLPVTLIHLAYAGWIFVSGPGGWIFVTRSQRQQCSLEFRIVFLSKTAILNFLACPISRFVYWTYRLFKSD